AIGLVTPKSKKSDGPRGELTLDANGKGQWAIPLDEITTKKPSADRDRFHGPWKLSVAAEIREEGGRAVTAATSADLDTLPWYVGVRARSEGSAAVPGRAATFDVKLIDPSGNATAASARLEASLFAESWNNTLVYEK